MAGVLRVSMGKHRCEGGVADQNDSPWNIVPRFVGCSPELCTQCVAQRVTDEEYGIDGEFL